MYVLLLRNPKCHFSRKSQGTNKSKVLLLFAQPVYDTLWHLVRSNINTYFNYTTEKLDPEKCYTNIGGFPGMSAPCKFPFTYKGNEYHKCIKKDWDNHWCELDMNHSASHKGHTFKISHESHKWGNCMPGKSCGFGEC